MSRSSGARRLRFRIGDFAIDGNTVTLVKTGNSAVIDRAVVHEVGVWLLCWATVRLIALRHVFRRDRPAVWFVPDRPAARYMVHIAAVWAGVRFARGADCADAAFFFEDATVSEPPSPGNLRAFNFGCGDISKSRVATVFAHVFGYPLALDPETWTGPALEKNEANGAHDGRIVECPVPPRMGMVYQRVIDTVVDGFATDLRTHVIGGRVVAVWIKRRTAAGRFQPANVAATLVAPGTVFSESELAAIGAFAVAFGADWAGLDILRDRESGRIYIVDVNKTDAGPIIALPFADKLRSIALLANALTVLVQPPSSAASASTRSASAA